MQDLEEVIKNRYSVRQFLPRPVPSSLVTEALEVAQRAPSNSNTQPWRLFLASGPAMDRLKEALMNKMRDETDFSRGILPLPASLQHHRFELGSIVYKALGIDRNDAETRRRRVLRNFEFFDAPLGGAICIPSGMGPADALGVGMWLQTLMLALTARGLGSIAQISLTCCSDVLRRELDIPDELEIICGLAIGYPDEEFRLNVGRDPIENNVTFRCE